MRRLITMLLILISAVAMYMTISSHKPREPDLEPINRYFDNAGRYYTMECYR